MKNKILCIQISNNLINDKPDLTDISQLYYDTLYKVKAKDGYIKPSEFWEIPLWVTEINHNIETDFYICTDIQKTIDYLLNSDYTYVCFSVLDVNEDIIKNIIKLYNKQYPYTDGESTFILGGYINFDKFLSDKYNKYGRQARTSYDKIIYHNVNIAYTVKEFIEYLGIEYKQGNSYKLFKGFKTIPRLTLSTGCLNNCDFCTVENKITKINTCVIEQQVKAFKPLKFKLVYINDKTFGQCTNYKLLPRIYKAIKEYNKEFKGFIIQTTTGQLLKISDKYIKEAHIKYIELGIETFNDHILKQYHKPSSEKTTVEAMRKIRNLRYCRIFEGIDIKVIPNIIIGLTEETTDTYIKTLHFLHRYKNIISHLNIYNLAVYDNTKLAKRIKPSSSNNNELKLNTSKQCNINFYSFIHQFGIDILKGV